MKKKEIVAVSYIDACYFKNNESVPNNFEFSRHTAVGKVFVLTDSDLTLVFKEKEGVPENGLVIPISALILKEDKVLHQSSELLNKEVLESNVEVFWQDLVYFQNGSIPDRSTTMCSKGELLQSNDMYIVLKDPLNYKEKDGKDHYPRDKNTDVAYLYIPKTLITDMNTYD